MIFYAIRRLTWRRKSPAAHSARDLHDMIKIYAVGPLSERAVVFAPQLLTLQFY